ncbi:glycoside hydrolase superfamily [Gymnopilus junonius]|uniref:mannan endo-1,4-beta-mannosidase n=1 Tax=Gymnopilus junonius TaxID=109634 RepID=A0A9P5NR02_GYMJU|nr:glycoside hydrolase superfamily [Gymnopilus junonius]
MHPALIWQAVCGALLVSAASPTRTQAKRSAPPSKFVTTQGPHFMVNGSKFDFVGTNAYWLAALNSEEDIDHTLGNISAKGIKVVRTWAFNDVTTIPENGTWFQLIANGTTTINNGTNGLQKLDAVVRLAEKHGLLLHFSLTNNWNPLPLVDNSTSGVSLSARDVTNGTNNTLPRNFLSNDYDIQGGWMFMSANLHLTRCMMGFYTNETILSKFMNYTTQVVSRYVDSPAIFAWCNSSVASSPTCTTTTITQFHSTVAQHISTVDPNHLVASGTQGFFCADCTKLFPRVVPPPQTSPAPNSRRAAAPKPLTRRSIIQERKEAFKKTRQLQKRTGSETGGIRIRGRWVSTETRRQSADDQGVGSAFDGSQGVDTFFPDQNSYGVDDPSLPAFNNTLNQGLDWIRRQAESWKIPVSLTGFGLVTQANAPFFVPFNETQAPFGSDSSSNQTQQPFGVTDAQQNDAYTQWLEAGLSNGLQGMVQYQWSQANLTTAVGTVVSPTVSGTGVSPTVTGTGLSPNDGYAINSIGYQAAQQFGADSN